MTKYHIIVNMEGKSVDLTKPYNFTGSAELLSGYMISTELNHIGNELAEQNRLKRLELQILWSTQSKEWKDGSLEKLDKILMDDAK